MGLPAIPAILTLRYATTEAGASMKIEFKTIIGVVCASLPISSFLYAAELPETTTAQLRAMKLNESIMAALDEELIIPQVWLDAVKKEPPVKILST